MRVTANAGGEGERLLKVFQDNKKTISTILTTSLKLSPDVDARPTATMTRDERVHKHRQDIFRRYDDRQRKFIEFVLDHHMQGGNDCRSSYSSSTAARTTQWR